MVRLLGLVDGAQLTGGIVALYIAMKPLR